MISEADREAIAEAVSQRWERQRSDDRAWLQTAGEAVGVVAGAVALVYLLGGVVFAVRLLLDGLSVAETAALIGQMSRELLITTGFVQGLAPAALVGLVAGMVYGAAELPKVPSAKGSWPGLRTKTFGLPTWLLLLPLAGVLTVPAGVLLSVESRWSEAEIATIAFGVVVSYACVLLGWYGIRRLVPKRPRSPRRYRAVRGLLAGIIWTAMTLPASILLAGFVGFEQARICLRASPQPIDGLLVASTKEGVLLVQGVLQEKGEKKAVISVPMARVERLDYGLPAHLFPECTIKRP